MVNTETTHITPLDFRLTAAAQFRLLAAICDVTGQIVHETANEFLYGKLVNATVLSRADFIIQADVIINKFYAALDMAIKPSYSSYLVMLLFDQSSIQSAIHTDGFTSTVPGSNEYTIVSNFYPRHDNASFNNVSLLKLVWHKSSWVRYKQV